LTKPPQKKKIRLISIEKTFRLLSSEKKAPINCLKTWKKLESFAKNAVITRFRVLEKFLYIDFDITGKWYEIPANTDLEYDFSDCG